MGNLSINTIVLGEMQNITQILNMYVQYLGNVLQYHKILGSQLINWMIANEWFHFDNLNWIWMISVLPVWHMGKEISRTFRKSDRLGIDYKRLCYSLLTGGTFNVGIHCSVKYMYIVHIEIWVLFEENNDHYIAVYFFVDSFLCNLFIINNPK